MIFQMAYVSHAVYAMSDNELDEILQIARTNNGKLQITGMLIYASDTFFQVLEGPKVQVEALYHRILFDDRHFGAKILHSIAANERKFANWSMGFERVKESQREYEFFFDLAQQSLTQQLGNYQYGDVLSTMEQFGRTKTRHQ